ncbi:urea ABC transporter permease subunit UrtB [Agaribacterium sp. ZY112]|uniref:urea ABC transporter permease subunit UrtB n=1 Tax=Agaribacterium sp. ZY112 TaxID=3233574 RepID=UPI0035237A4D
MNLLANLTLILGVLLGANSIQAKTFEDVLPSLNQGSYGDKAEAIELMATIDDERVLPTFLALLDARLFFKKDSSTFVILKDVKDLSSAKNAITGEVVAVDSKRAIKKVRINNKLRRTLRPLLAVLQLSSDDVKTRLSSAQDLAKKPDPSLRSIIDQAYKTEEVNKVKNALELTLALIDIKSDVEAERLLAVGILGSSVEPEVVAVLKTLAEKNEDGTWKDQHAAVAELAAQKLAVVEDRVKLFKFSENIIFGLSLGSILLLAAIGLAITFGVMGVINMAHGEMIMLGAYTTFAIQQLFPSMMNWSLLMAIPAAFLVSGFVGVLIERLVIRHLYGRPLDTLLATFGISLILQQAVRMYSSNNVAVVTPDWLAGYWAVNGAMSLTYNRIYILVFALIVLAMLAVVLKRTMMGLQMRAVTQNRAMATSMGIRSGWVDAMTFGLGSGIAGIAGVALSQITNVGPNLGQGYIIDSFMVVVFGGVGNLLGTFFGAMSLGLANKLLEPYAGAVVGKIIVLVFIILFIQWRPRGLFALKGRFVED